ncbi:daunorubicin resistance protein DrrA family ABC transporter ATP-binding protein [Sciscionella marina]|uniref:daunorubicin resistance protein DrrA family ABC transporter ATP-binding protein n=1 Tax=Sciscionella marina TaxID=508770 RepID=UPI00036BA172|nr:daunorubicin resistance protein DrrA family ABC transporter ATP-binding protein [Sciscionella marina]
MNVVALEDVHKRFGPTEALRGLSLTVAEGSILGVLGPNGAGKTTAINVLTTLVRPDSGRASVAGYDTVTEPDRARSVIGVTGQFAALDENLTARENLNLFARLNKLGRYAGRRRAGELLEAFGLAEVGDRRCGGFSGGMRRRLDLAVSIIARPLVLFLDEPTTGLDPNSRAALWEMVRGLRAEGVTILLTTQYLQEADELADQIAVIDGGQVIAEGSVATLKAKIGGAVCHLTLADPGTRARARDILGARYRITENGQLLSVPAQGSRTLTEVLRTLDTHEIEVDDAALRHPSLDDVFFALTGAPSTGAPE